MLSDQHLDAVAAQYEGIYRDENVHRLIAEIRRQRGILRFIANMEAQTYTENRIKQLAAQAAGLTFPETPPAAPGLDSWGGSPGDGGVLPPSG